jgi:hypothetical protein
MTLLCLLGGFAVCLPANATGPDSARNPYRQIAQWNAFRLKPLQAVPVEPQPRPPLPRVTLTGITTILHDKRVLLKVQFPANPPEPAREQSYILKEGQRTEEIEILEVDERAGSVRISISGTAMLLTIEKDGPKLPDPSQRVVIR